MVLDRFIGSRIQHPDARVRMAALARLPATDPLLIDSALGDGDGAVRRAALERLIDPDTLDRASRQDADEGNRDVAAARLRSLLAGADTEEPPPAVRTAWIEAGCPAALLEFLAEHAASPAVRAAAVARVDDETVLARVAIHDSTAELRRTALGRVRSAPILEEIEHATRSRDHGVSRAARTRVQALHDAQVRQEGAETLCARMEALAAGTANAFDEAAFHRLEQEWSASGAGARDALLAARYERSREAFRGLLARRAHARQARIPLLAQRVALLAELQHAAGITPELARRAAETLAETQREWESVPESDPAEMQRFAALGAEIESHRRRLQQAHAQAQPLRSLIDEARARADAPSPIARAEIRSFEERAQRAPRPEDGELARTLDHELGEVFEGLRQRQRREHEQAAGGLDQIQSAVAAMEEALARGEVAAALLKHDEAQSQLKTVEPGMRAVHALRQRLQRAAPKLEELRDWQRWGTEQTRTSMCVEVEALIGSAEPPEQLARRIRNYRKEWQHLDRASGTTSKSMWERFDRACTTAYAPCAAYFTEQRTTRSANLERKQALLERLEVLDRDTDWGAADLRAAERAYTGSEREWREVGPVDRSLAKTLVARHADLRKRLEARFAPRREAEIARRKAVIAELTALAQSDDVSHAIGRAKEAQAHWTPAVSARRGVEQALWNDFRTACDAVFARARAARDGAAEERRAAAQAGVSACERIEALAQSLSLAVTGEPSALPVLVEQARTQLAQLRREFSQSPRPSRGEEGQLAARFKAAVTKAERALAAAREALARVELEACAARARLCSELEHRALGNGDADMTTVVDEMRRAWDALPAVSGTTGEAVERRFATACEAARSLEKRATLAATLAAQTDEKRRLCLRFEIVAGVPSPPAHDAARLSYRAQWMQDSMRGTSHWPGTEREKLEEARRIEARWHALGATPVSEDASLEERYRCALDALRRSMGATG